MSDADSTSAPAPLVAVLCWLIPGSGYFLIGQKLRGAIIGITILAMFIFGVLLAGIRVIDVPGFDDRGFGVYYQMQVNSHGDAAEIKTSATIHGPPQQARWSMVSHPFAEITNKPWFVPQFVAGPICLLAAHWSNSVAHAADLKQGAADIPRTHGRIYEIGTLYTAIAGMLNLLAIIDAASRASGGN